MVTLNETKANGSTASLRMSLTVSDQTYRLFFKAGEWNAIVRAGLKAGGEKWIVDYLPLRFTNYAIAQLGYRTANGYRRAKMRDKMPLVKTGQLQETALSQSWAEARATSSNASVTLHIATGAPPPDKNGNGVGYGAQPLVHKTLTTITDREIGVIALTMEATIKALVDGATTTTSRKGTVRKALSQTSKSALRDRTRRTREFLTTKRA